MLKQQKAIGNNLNQLAMLCNMGRLNAVNLDELLKQHTEVTNAICAIAKAVKLLNEEEETRYIREKIRQLEVHKKCLSCLRGKEEGRGSKNLRIRQFVCGGFIEYFLIIQTTDYLFLLPYY